MSKKEELIRLTDSLLQNPPHALPELKERYQKIRSIIEALETGKEDLPRLLNSLDADFEPVRKLYPYHSEDFLNQSVSVLADEYRFFVGGIRSYIKSL
jgi:archaellum component FlaC